MLYHSLGVVYINLATLLIHHSRVGITYATFVENGSECKYSIHSTVYIID